MLGQNIGRVGLPDMSAGGRPSLTLDFVSIPVLNEKITFTRASTARYFDSAGVLQSAAVNEARFDYNPSTLAARGLLIEEQRTNSIRNNTMVGAVAGTPGTLPTNWVASVGGLNYAVVGTGTENGISYIDLRFNGTPSTTGPQTLAPDSLTSTIGFTWNVSGWIKLVAGSFTNVSQITLRVASEAGGTVFTPTSTLTRYENTRTLTTATAAWTLRWNYIDTVTPVDFTLRIGLPQQELGAFATSVIPTTTTALTRSADVASVNTLTPWYSATEGTLYSEATFTNTVSFNTVAALSDGTTLNSMRTIQWNDGTDRIWVISNAGAAQAAYTGTGQVGTAKFAGAYKLNDVNASKNGSIGITDTTATIPTINALWLGQTGSALFLLNGWLRRVSYFPRRLANAELQSLTS